MRASLLCTVYKRCERLQLFDLGPKGYGMQDLLTGDEVAKHLSMTKKSIYILMKKNGFPRPFKLGAAARWDIDDVDAWVRAQDPYVLSPWVGTLYGTVISEADMPQELIPAFLAEVLRRDLTGNDARLVADAEEMLDTRDFRYGYELALDLMFLLGEGLPKTIVFGAHPERPNDFGYWRATDYPEGVSHVS